MREATGGDGVKHVLEMVGGDHLRRSVNALAANGRISLIGRLVDTEFTAPIVPIMRKRLTIQGISVDSRLAFERMNKAIEAVGIKPVIAAVYPFEQAKRVPQIAADLPQQTSRQPWANSDIQPGTIRSNFCNEGSIGSHAWPRILYVSTCGLNWLGSSRLVAWTAINSGIAANVR